jgi:hypothetical protein
MIKDNLALTGALTIAINDKVVQKTDNLVVTSGKAWVAGMMQGTGSVMSHMALGTGTSGSAAAGDTVLGGLPATSAELANSRQAFSTSTSYDATARTITYTNTWVAESAAGAPTGSGTGAITEAGIFDANSGGTMLARTIFAVVNKGADDSMTITWTIEVS